MVKFNLLKEMAADKKIFSIAVKKIILETLLSCSKYVMLVYLLDSILICISNSDNYGDFVFIILMNVLCVAVRTAAQNIETYYINDMLKLSLEKNLLEKLFDCFRKMPLNKTGQNQKDNEYKLNFIKSSSYIIADNISLMTANSVLLLLTLTYVMRFSPLYLMILIFPVFSFFLNELAAGLEVKISKNEAGILQVMRELKKITTDKKALIFFCNYSFFEKFKQYKDAAFCESLSLNKPGRRESGILYFISSLLRIGAVFFGAVFISIHLAKKSVIDTIDIVVIINACNMMAGAVSVIVSKMVKNIVLLRNVNQFFDEFNQEDLMKIDEDVYSLKLDNVAFRYQDDEKMMKYNLFIEKGDKKVIVGSNGCGKSTLLKIILGYIRPDEGNIIINDKIICGNYRIDTAISLFEPYPLLNISFKDYITEPAQDHMDASEYLDFIHELGINLFKKMNFGNNLSSGTCQAVNLIRILCSNKDFVILDEPTSKLNIKFSLPLVKKIMEKKDTVIITTHDDAVISMFPNQDIVCLNRQ